MILSFEAPGAMSDVTMGFHRIRRLLPRGVTMFVAIFLSFSPALAADNPFHFSISHSEQLACPGDQRNALLNLDKGFSSVSENTSENELRAFYLEAGRTLDPPAENRRSVAWMREHNLVERVLLEPALLDLVELPEDSGAIALLRPGNSIATCGSGGCSTPVFVALGCEQASPMGCLAEGLEARRTRALAANSIAFTRHEDETYLQAISCFCQGVRLCYRSTTIWRVDHDLQLLLLEARAIWHEESFLATQGQ